MDQLSALGAARSEFDRRLRQVQAGDWDRSTPCEGWTVRDLVVHVLSGSRMAAALFGGCSTEAAVAIVDAEVFPDDPIATFQEVADLAGSAVAVDGAMDMIVHHPAGDFPGSVMLGFLTADYALHAWDLARAIGADETLPENLVAAIWANIEPLIPAIGQIGVFGSGPSGTVPDDAPLQTRLLDATGRRP
ncbi:MAG: TIGR03086 family protein [Acidimicrobiia bacterium]|nr:TIGR03086 family protein [Acidimicrobiia bacterium]